MAFRWVRVSFHFLCLTQGKDAWVHQLELKPASPQSQLGDLGRLPRFLCRFSLLPLPPPSFSTIRTFKTSLKIFFRITRKVAKIVQEFLLFFTQLPLMLASYITVSTVIRLTVVHYEPNYRCYSNLTRFPARVLLPGSHPAFSCHIFSNLKQVFCLYDLHTFAEYCWWFCGLSLNLGMMFFP